MTSKYWTQAWNPMTGCTPVSPGCERCWAKAMSRRFWTQCEGCSEGGMYGEPCEDECYFTPTRHPDRLDAPLHWRKPRRVFVCNMGDLFHEAFVHAHRDRVLEVAAKCPQHTFMLLTKRVDEMSDYFDQDGHYAWHRVNGGRPLPNVQLGVTVCNQEEAWKIDVLRQTPAAVRWLSLEPLLGPLLELNLTGISWLVLGGESGPGARPMDPRWATQVFKDCREAGVPFWFKQPGSHLAREDKLGPTGRDWALWDAMVRTQELPAALTEAVRAWRAPS